MSSTRRAAENTPLRQERFLSSPEFEDSLKAYPVAKRCTLLKDRRDRELIWWLQWKSQEPQGLADMVDSITAEHPEAFATPTMHKLGLKPSQQYSREQMLQIREEIFRGKRRLTAGFSRPYSLAQVIEEGLFPLRGEKTSREASEEFFEHIEPPTHPESYSAAELHSYCSRKAGGDNLLNYLVRACIDPAASLSDSEPWFFSGLRSLLLDRMDSEAKELRGHIVVTAIGRKVHRCLDMALKTRSLVVVNGVARIGKSHSARTWCEQRPGVARYVEVPSSNDDIGFLRAVARGIGLGNFLKYKATEIRERVEAVLITGQLLLVLDEAHKLWPQMNYRYGHPTRINWLMSLVNKGVPICALTTPQFFTHLQHVEQHSGWASEQLTGRITHHEQLPAELADADLEAVARNVLPEAGDIDIAALVAYARSSAKYLAAIDSIAKCARYFAEEDGRTEVRRGDIQRAMRDGAIPSDKSLAKALQAAAPKRRKPPGARQEAPQEEAAAEPLQRAGRGAAAPMISSASPGRAMRPAGDLVGA